MGTTFEDIAYEMAMEEQYLDELYDKHIDEFTEDRLRSYFLSNPEVAQIGVKALKTAKSLLESDHPTPALIYAAIVQEFTIKNILLRALVHGLVNNEIAATIITKFAIGYGSPSKFKEMILQLLSKYGGIDLSTYKRAGVKKTLWKEMDQIINQRNDAVHDAKTFTKEEAEMSINVAIEILDKIFPRVIATLGLHLHDYKICNCQNIS